MNHLNYFEPYKGKEPYHEDQLTRAFLVILRMIPLVQTAFIDLIRSYQICKKHNRVLPALTEPLMRLENIQTQVTSINDSQGYLASLLMTNKNRTPETVIENVDRSARYDGVIYFDSDPKWILVIENKPWSKNVWEEQLKPNISKDSDSKIEIVKDPVGIDWKKVIERLSALLQKQLVHGAEALLIEDFLIFVDTHFRYLNPFSKFSICKDDPYLINRRCVRILESIGDVQDQHIELGSNDLPARRIYLSIKQKPDNNWCIELKIHPGDTMTQAHALYKILNTDALLNLNNEGWDIYPNLHFSHIDYSYRAKNIPLSLEDYINFWKQHPKMISQVRRDFSDFRDFFQQLLHLQLIGQENVSGLKENFTKTGRSYLRTCPGLNCIYRWDREKAIRLDDSNDKFIGEVRKRIKILLDTWDQELPEKENKP